MTDSASRASSALTGASSAVGFLGGSFDPPHAGHVALAHAARAALALSEVRFVPAADPWQKSGVSAAPHRAHMVALALAEEPHLALDMREIERGGASYTVDTLAELRAAHGADRPLVWIIGGDQFERLDTWSRWTQLLTFGHLAVATRNGTPLRLNAALETFRAAHLADPHTAMRRPAGHVIAFDMTPVDVSATQLRTLLGKADAMLRSDERTTLSRMLTPAVLDYIHVQSLYPLPSNPSNR